MKTASVGLFLFFVVACTGGAGPIDNTGGSSSGGSSSGGSSSGGSSSGGSSSGAVGQEIRASEFSQTCSENSDCAVVYEGAICNQCGCPNAAISKSAMGDYAAKRQGAGCPTTDVACAGDCQEAYAICSGGTCSMTRTAPDGG